MNDAVNKESSLFSHQFFFGIFSFLFGLSGTNALGASQHKLDAENQGIELPMNDTGLIERQFEWLLQSRSTRSTQLDLLKEELNEKVSALKKVVVSLNEREEKYRRIEIEIITLAKKLEGLETIAQSQSILGLSLEHLLNRHQEKIKALEVLLPQVQSAFSKLTADQQEFDKELIFWNDASASLDKAIEQKNDELKVLARAFIEKGEISVQPKSLRMLYKRKASEIDMLESDLCQAIDKISQLMSFIDKAYTEISILQLRLAYGKKKFDELRLEKENLSKQLLKVKQSDIVLAKKLSRLNVKLHARKEQKAYYKQGTAYLEQQLGKHGKEITASAVNFGIVGSEQDLLNKKIKLLKIRIDSNSRIDQFINKDSNGDGKTHRSTKSNSSKHENITEIENI